MADPLFSVIIPTFSRPGLLAEAIVSVQRQEVEDFECIVVDDASPEAPKLPDDPRFRLIQLGQRSGPAIARNRGIESARGRSIAFLDDDDVFTADRLSLALEGLDRAPVAVCWSGTMGEPSTSGRTLEGDVADSIMDSTTPHVGATSVRRSHLERFDPRYRAVEDVEWWLRLASRSRVATAPRVGHLFRRHGAPRSLNGLEERVKGSLQLLEDHVGYFAAHPSARAFRWKRIGLMSQRLGDHALARRAFVRSLRLRPEPAVAWHLARSMRPNTNDGRSPPDVRR